jgi:hypothetical protein
LTPLNSKAPKRKWVKDVGLPFLGSTSIPPPSQREEENLRVVGERMAAAATITSATLSPVIEAAASSHSHPPSRGKQLSMEDAPSYGDLRLCFSDEEGEEEADAEASCSSENSSSSESTSPSPAVDYPQFFF